jgi:hypothetical protein
MAISPFTARPGSPETEGRRARIVIALATLGIAASLLAYAVSPSVRHVVGHAAHSVKHAVGRVFDRDEPARGHVGAKAVKPAHAHVRVYVRPAARTGGTSAPAPAGTAPRTSTAPG